MIFLQIHNKKQSYLAMYWKEKSFQIKQNLLLNLTTVYFGQLRLALMRRENDSINKLR